MPDPEGPESNRRRTSELMITCQPMNILHVIAGMNPSMGGVSQAVRTMCTELTKQGMYNEVTGLDSPGEPFLQNEPALIHRLGPAKTPWSYGAKFGPWLVNNLHRFDVILLHGLWLYHGYALQKAIQTCRDQRTQLPCLQVDQTRLDRISFSQEDSTSAATIDVRRWPLSTSESQGDHHASHGLTPDFIRP